MATIQQCDDAQLESSPHTPERPTVPTLTLVQWATGNGLVLTDAVDAHIQAGLRSAPTTKTFRRWYFAELTRLQGARDRTVQLYRTAVANGEVIDPNACRLHRLMKTANGHPDNESVQAARRILTAMGMTVSSRSPE